jgi:hypothetical protein
MAKQIRGQHPMKNITVSVDDETYRRARLWAADRETSVSAIVKCILVTLPARVSAGSHRPAAQGASNPAYAVPSPQRPTSANETVIPSFGVTVLRKVLARLQSLKPSAPPPNKKN